MTSSDPGGPVVRRGRGRRPIEDVRRDVLAAAGRLLLEEGMAGFTIEKVAALAGASKVTIYKLWPSKGTLALEGYAAGVGPTLRFPDTGEVEADLRAQLRSFVDLLTTTSAGPAISQLIGQAQTDPDLRAAYGLTYSRPRRALAVEVLERARSRGQVRADLDPEPVVDQLWGACYHRLLVPDQPLTHEFVDALVDNLFRGVGPGAGAGRVRR